jgi:subtilisin family serine protease
MLLFCFLYAPANCRTIHLDHAAREYRGRLINFASSRQLRHTSTGWYFVLFQTTPDPHSFESLSTKPDLTTMITPLFHHMYLTSAQVSELRSALDCPITPFQPSDKIVGDLTNHSIYLAVFHPSFRPACQPAFRYKQLSNTTYEISNSNLDSLLAIPELLRLSPAPRVELTNRWNAGYVQRRSEPTMTTSGYETERYLQDRLQLDGRGTVVTIIDSGLDANHSFFFDPDRPSVEMDTEDQLHRKIVYYDSFADDSDVAGGHGTMVAGTVAGNSTCRNGVSLYNGVAPGAKLVFIDAGQPTSETLATYPAIMLANRMSALQSHVSANAWGSRDRSSDYHGLFEELAYYSEDKLFVFAVGNDETGDGGTVSTPGACKNVLTVGAIGMRAASTLEEAANRRYAIVDQGGVEYEASLWGGGADFFGLALSILESETSTQSEPGKVLVETNDVCGLAVEPLAAIITADSQQCEKQLSFPVFVVTASNFNGGSVTKVTVKMPILADPGPVTVASFSAKGPSHWNILKPEVLAPGTSIVSAKAGPNSYECDLDQLISASGTSQAAPSVAGAALLVEQYFRDGHYHNLPFTPDGCLLRAMLIASADWDPIDPSIRYPTNEYGHGIVNLANVLSLDPLNVLQVVQKVKLEEKAGHKMFSFRVQNPIPNVKLRIAMAYLDEVSGDWLAALILDLDLYLKTPTGEIIFGNQYPDDQPEREERFSTAERIVLIPGELVAGGTYEIHVVGNGNWGRLASNECPFSLVVSGPIVYQDDFPPTDVKTEPCPAGKTGTLCEIDPPVIVEEPQSFHIRANSHRYFRINCPPTFGGILLYVSRTPSASSSIRIHFAVDSIPIAQSLYGLQISTEADEMSVRIPGSMIGAAKFVGMIMSNAGIQDFECELFMAVEAPTPAATAGPRIQGPKDWYGGMVAASVAAAVLAVFVLFLAVRLFKAKRVFHDAPSA